MQLNRWFALSFTLCVGASAVAGDTLRGAASVLEELDVLRNTQGQKSDKPPTENAKLRADISGFAARAVTLAPADAAGGWIALADRLAKLPPPTGFSPEEEQLSPMGYGALFAALPPPAAWDDLKKALAARHAPTALKDTREICLRMLTQALTGDRASLAAQTSAFGELLRKTKRDEARPLAQAAGKINQVLLSLSNDPNAIISGLEMQIKQVEREDGNGYGLEQLPDLVEIVGEARATPLIERALISKAQRLSIHGKATNALARRLALKLADKLKVPRWDLVNSPDAVELCEALEKKFEKTNAAAKSAMPDALSELASEPYDRSREKGTAQTYYIMGLIVRGRTAEAAKFARALKDQDENSTFLVAAGEAALARAGFMREVDDFLHTLLTEDPALPLWESYFEIAAKTGNTGRMLALSRKTAEVPGLTGSKRNVIRLILYRALLAADEIEEGVKELRSLLVATRKAEATGNRVRGIAHQYDLQQDAFTLARLGKLLGKPEWVEEAIAAAMPKQDAPENEGDSDDSYQMTNLAEILVQVGRLEDAEKVMARQLAKDIKVQDDRPFFGGYGGDAGPAWRDLNLLVQLYHHAGRHADVLLLLEKSPDWGAKDLAQLVTNNNGGLDFDFGPGGLHHPSNGNPMGEAAAAALVNAGRKDEARVIVGAMLNERGGDDRVYELLLQLDGQAALPKLDALFARDPFEERPLIWKALLLHQAGKDEEAENIARKAIAIDPSDGEEGKGDRMRVYAVLAEIRAARGDLKDAEFFRGVVRAIRLSEDADDFFSAGLLTRAVKMYEESLTHFTDAYCIQSRLAVHLSELGQHELAAKHYEKAFELMPDSFGRVESHCFGCEGTFRGDEAQSVAERVFTKLAEKNPDKPQIHYLLGYLREEQGRGRDALPHFQRAVNLDPDYLNAWKKLEALSSEHHLPSTERDAIAFNILRLDPLGRHGTPSLNNVSDLRALWRATEAAGKFRVESPATLLPLTASSAKVEKAEREAKIRVNPFGGVRSFYRTSQSEPKDLGAFIARHDLISAIAGLADAAAQNPFEE